MAAFEALASELAHGGAGCAAGRLVTVLERYRDRWDPKELAELARHLREFADSLDNQKGGKKTRKD